VEHRHASDYVALLHGSSLRFGLCCPDPSSLTRPDPPHSQAQHNFIAWRLICAAFAVRERLSNPRVVPGFRCTFRPGMPSPKTPGSSTSISSRQRCRHWPSSSSERLGTPNIPAIRFTRGVRFRGFHGSRICYGLPSCSPPLHGSDRSPGRRGLLLPGFQRLGRPSRCWI
jgi:hypothetical protein